jgi:hypothetical protein
MLIRVSLGQRDSATYYDRAVPMTTTAGELPGFGPALTVIDV